jgi:hypothetical protein
MVYPPVTHSNLSEAPATEAAEKVSVSTADAADLFVISLRLVCGGRGFLSTLFQADWNGQRLSSHHRFTVTIQAVTVGSEARLARTPFWACGHWSAFARYGRLINRPCLAAPSEAVSAQADTWREAPEEGDFNRLNSYVLRF